MAVAAASLAQRAAACSSAASSSGRGASDAAGGSHGARPRESANGVTTKLLVVSTSAPAATNCVHTSAALRACGVSASLAGRGTHLTVHRGHQLRLPQIGIGCLGEGVAQAALLERVAHRAVEDQPAWSHVVALAAVASPGQLVRNWVGGDAAKPKSLYLPLAHPGVPTAGRQARNQVGRFVRNCGFTRHRSHLVLPPITQRA